MPRKDETVETEVEVAPVAETFEDKTALPPIEEPVERKKAVIVMKGVDLPSADLRVVVEARTYSGGTSDEDPVKVEVKKSHYPKGADIYFRYDPEVSFPADAAEVVTMGVDVHQGGMAGFTKQPGYLNVGPAHPAYAAANLAYQRGATVIEIVGLTDAEKERLQPYFDGLANHPAEPAQVAVSLT